MALTYVNQIGADGGIAQSAPNTGISEANLVWAQDVLFDRPGFIRRRGPFNEKTLSEALNPGEMIMGITSSLDPNGEWRLCALVGGPSSTRFVFISSSGGITGFSWLPFKHPNGGFLYQNSVSQNNDVRTSNPMTMFVGRPALSEGAFLSVFTYYGVPVFSNSSQYPRFQSLYYWRGGYGVDCYLPGNGSSSGASIAVEGEGVASQLSKTITITGAALDIATSGVPRVTPGMFVFDADPAVAGRPYQCIGVVKSVDSETNPNQIVLEKRPMLAHDSGVFASSTNVVSAYSFKTLHFRNVRGFQHLHGRGLVTLNSGNVVTSGLEGTDAEGHFGAAKFNEGEWYVYRNSDHAIMGKVDGTGALSNTQFTLTSSGVKVKLNSDEYVAVRKATVLSTDNNTTNVSGSLWASEPSPYYQGRISGQVDDAAAGTSYDPSARSFTDVPGYFTTTYAGYQWFGSLGQRGYENQIIFSSYHNPEAVDLSPDASDSIVIPGNNIMRGLATSSAGLIIFMSDNTYILRGNNRANFSLEVLYPEGCLGAGSIVEIGGGVMWAATSGILYFDGASVRNLTNAQLGTYYYDGVKHFDANADRLYAFVYKNYLFMHFSKWQSAYSFNRFEPVYVNLFAGDEEGENITYNNVVYTPNTYLSQGFTWDDMVNRRAALTYDRIRNIIPFVTFGIYLPTGSITSFSNFEFTGAAFVDAVNALSSSALNYDKAWVSVNARKRRSADFIPNKPANEVISATGTGTVTVSFIPNRNSVTGVITDVWVNGDVVDLLDRNDDPVVSSVTISSLSLPSSGDPLNTPATFTYAGNAPTGVVGLHKPEFVTYSKGLFVGLDQMLDLVTNDYDDYISLATRYTGPDLYFQTKIYTVGDPVIKKWFQRLMVSMLIKGGAVRVDMLDYENNDFITTQIKERNWLLLPEVLYTWSKAQDTQFAELINGTNIQNPDGFIGVTWGAVEAYATSGGQNISWDDVFFPAFERRTKRFSLRTNALGYQFYQLNRWKPSDSSSAAVLKPQRVETDAWSIGFKPLRSGRQ